MGKRKSEVPFQSRGTDAETVSVALGISQVQITYTLLQGLLAGLQHTASPLKDAAERLLEDKGLGKRYEFLMGELQDMITAEERQYWTKSAMVPIERDDERWNATVAELQDVLFRMI